MSNKRAKAVVAAEAQTKAATETKTAEAAEEPISTALKIDDLKVELGYALLPLVNSPDGSDRLTEQIKALRRSLAAEMGFVMPAVRILDNVNLDSNTYVIKIKEVEAGSGKIWAGPVHGHGSVRRPGEPARHAHHRADLRPARDLGRRRIKEEAAMQGFTVVDAATVLSTHLTEMLKNNMSDLLSYGEVQKLLKDLPKEQAELLKDLVPTLITTSGIQRVLQILLAERVSIRDLSTILEGIADGAGSSRNPRHSGRACARPHLAPDLRAVHQPQRLPAAHRACRRSGNRPSPNRSSARATTAIWRCSRRSCRSSSRWCARTSRPRRAKAKRRCWSPRPAIRPFVRGIVERFRAQTPVISQTEIHPRARLKTVGSI